jgi:hypothetical protein
MLKGPLFQYDESPTPDRAIEIAGVSIPTIEGWETRNQYGLILDSLLAGHVGLSSNYPGPQQYRELAAEPLKLREPWYRRGASAGDIVANVQRLLGVIEK